MQNSIWMRFFILWSFNEKSCFDKYINQIMSEIRNIQEHMTPMLHDCPICHGGQKQLGKTTFTVDLGFGVVVVRDVPAQVCDLCGTDWIEDLIAEKLERVVNEARQKHPVIEVVSWDNEASAIAR